MTAVAPAPPDHTSSPVGRTHLGWVVAGASAAAGAIHLAMVPGHAGGSLLDPLGFALVGWFQLLVAGIVLADRGGRSVYKVAVVGNLAVTGLWLWSRTAGLPVGEHAGVAEEVTVVDGSAVALQLVAVVAAAWVLLAPGRVAAGRLAPALLAVGALGLATTVITSADAAEHGGSGHAHGEEAAAGDHGHGADDADRHATWMADVDEARCDTGFNIDAYWEETDYFGIDTYQGGAIDMSAAGGHDHGGGASAAGPAATEPDPTGGRGSAGLDELVALTSASGDGEGAAAALVTGLGEASEADYDAWRWWARTSGAVGGGHGDHSAAAPDDAGGHGGHAGPQPWTAMTDPAQCARLEEEVALARETALAYPTAADATEAGWVRVTGYVPGIAAHYMNFALVDGEFAVDEPEMILYDGDGPDAHVVGLSYYVIQDGDAEPTQGFTGDNDHYHRHVGLCQGPGGVIGDSTTTEEECAARGGVKANGSKGWMSHAWVVPGCESPWGLFSAATPLLEEATGEASGDNDGACVASAVRERYGMGTGVEVAPASVGGG
ncbi:hypothetical protein PO878_20880 [Iamia majanohamensis]|uniref:Uncharacterized protein n=1 Tax=Iamia majanohamensis TaxID=467976 RepID=A0AAF0BTL2_9ACTN|nr:hypothetical protein [Iamia majanohamensis]WCO66952.1 hypothetical protein PO878_20880 [Iamia majanohamensis]